MTSLKDLLVRAPAYIALQRAVGADRLRYRCIDELDLSSADTVVDVGCGPAYYFERLPQTVTYHGFDTEPRYIEWARKRWGDRATFHLRTFDLEQAAALAPVDAVMLLGLVHHMPDDEASDLLALSARVLAPGGRVVTVDPCFEPSQGRISRWMSANDRGEYVRRPDQFTDLAMRWFDVIDGEVLSRTTRVPSSHWMMTMRQPRNVEPLVHAVASRSSAID